MVSKCSCQSGKDDVHNAIPRRWWCGLHSYSESRLVRGKVSGHSLIATFLIKLISLSCSSFGNDEANNRRIVGVMGIDFTLGYFHKLLMDSTDVCAKEHVTCFIMDDRGYLVAHPGLVEPAGRGPVEYTHIIHKEPFVANDLLNHKNFVRKNVCNSFSDRTIQRYYNVSRYL